VKLEVQTDPNCFGTLQSEWDALLSRSAVNEIFLTYDWQTTWWEAYHPGELRLIMARAADGELIGIAPWFVEQPSRTMRTIGCVDVTDYLDVIAVPEQHEAFCGALADYLLTACSSDVTALSLCNIQANSATLQALPAQLTARGFFVETERQEVCPIITLPATFDDYLGQLDKKQRHELRRKMRRCEDSEDDKVAWYIVGAEHDLTQELECFIYLMGSSHPDKAEFLQDAKNAAFFRAVMPKLAAHGWLQLAILTVNGEAAAAYISFDYQNRIGLYNSGLLPQSYSHLSTGIVLLTYIIRHAIEQGKTVFDFLRGNEDYKYRMGAQDTVVMELRATLKSD